VPKLETERFQIVVAGGFRRATAGRKPRYPVGKKLQSVNGTGVIRRRRALTSIALGRLTTLIGSSILRVCGLTALAACAV
jgi:hypothetical protein